VICTCIDYSLIFCKLEWKICNVHILLFPLGSDTCNAFQQLSSSSVYLPSPAVPLEMMDRGFTVLYVEAIYCFHTYLQHAWCIGTYMDSVEDHVMSPNLLAATEFRGLLLTVFGLNRRSLLTINMPVGLPLCFFIYGLFNDTVSWECLVYSVWTVSWKVCGGVHGLIRGTDMAKKCQHSFPYYLIGICFFLLPFKCTLNV